jgi:beta-phosphoglucomutase family hydrolase
MVEVAKEESSVQSKAVLWDLDGTLLDTAEYHWQAWVQCLADEGYVLTREAFARSFGQRNDTILRGYFGADMSNSEVDRISAAKEEKYRMLILSRGVELLPGVRQWLTRLNADGWLQAIASSAPLANIDAILTALKITSSFDALVSAEDVQYGKPNPQVFLRAAQEIRVQPSHCIVVEDAPAGIEAAHRAGMIAIGVLSSHRSLRADCVVSSLTDLPRDAFEKLLMERHL